MRTFRANATLGPLIGWNILAGISIAALLSAAAEARLDAERWRLYGVAGALLLLGPLCLVVYLVRSAFVRIDLAREGLVLSKRHLVTWEEIQQVELRGFRPGVWNPFTGLSDRFGCWSILFIKALLVIALIVFLLWLLRTVLLPVVVLFSPWQSRVVVTLRDGERLVYRDLEDAEHFVVEVRARSIQARPR